MVMHGHPCIGEVFLPLLTCLYSQVLNIIKQWTWGTCTMAQLSCLQMWKHVHVSMSRNNINCWKGAGSCWHNEWACTSGTCRVLSMPSWASRSTKHASLSFSLRNITHPLYLVWWCATRSMLARYQVFTICWKSPSLYNPFTILIPTCIAYTRLVKRHYRDCTRAVLGHDQLWPWYL